MQQPGTNVAHLKCLKIVNDLKGALATGVVDKVEVLIRWVHPEDGFIPPDTFIELAERDMMQDADRAVALMQNFKSRGFDLSVDDYGIGQSSLSKLKQMPVSELKIDKSFVLTLDQSDSNQIIVQSTIELGYRFHLKDIAEGVENWLKDHNTSRSQT